MISIDRISFEFAMDDEAFAQGLYANWDGFCRTCVEGIVEEYFSVYDENRVLHEIGKLSLDLGNIPQEDFYTEFPRRLREELLKALPPLLLGQTDMEELKTVNSRFANLLYYLKHGTLKTEWADINFDLAEELDRVATQDKRYMEKIAGLCMANEYILRRILLQADREAPLVRLYSTAMEQMFSVKDGKRHFMEIFLEMWPDVPLHFVYETEEDGRLHGMAELLGTHSVRRMMEKAAGEHAEVDLPPYWHYLYEWLIKYYPYNGIAIFGGKSNFIGHLHYRLLTFIHKRNSTFYLSKTELTAIFLQEVFRATYYKEVLNAIYNMQPRNADGSPAHDGYYDLQLYRVFMELSLLYLPESMNKHADPDTIGELHEQLDAVKKEDAKQALLLSRTINLLQKERGRFSFLSNMNISFTTALSEALLLFMQDKDTLEGRNLTEQEVVGKFLAHLYYVYTRRTDYNDNAEWKHLQDEVTDGLGLNNTETTSIPVSENVISERLFQNYMCSHPADLLRYIRHWAAKGKLPVHKWVEWADLSEWLRLTASISLTLEELLRQVIEHLLSQDEPFTNETILRYGLATFIATNDAARLGYYIYKAEVVRAFMLSLPVVQDKMAEEKEKAINQVMKGLGITTEEEKILEINQKEDLKFSQKEDLEFNQKDDSEITFISNAGLCLLSPWFPQLFALLGYLDEEKRSFKDIAARIRAVFLLQYLVSPEEKDYREPELAFNRLLVALPVHIPLPKRIELTDEEKRMADSMLEGVKGNWRKMDGTSVNGFRQSFIVRNGWLEQQDERWLLTVENRAFDFLFDSVPWVFRQIRFPWLKKYIQVLWYEKYEF